MLPSTSDNWANRQRNVAKSWAYCKHLGHTINESRKCEYNNQRYFQSNNPRNHNPSHYRNSQSDFQSRNYSGSNLYPRNFNDQNSSQSKTLHSTLPSVAAAPRVIQQIQAEQQM